MTPTHSDSYFRFFDYDGSLCHVEFDCDDDRIQEILMEWGHDENESQNPTYECVDASDKYFTLVYVDPVFRGDPTEEYFITTEDLFIWWDHNRPYDTELLCVITPEGVVDWTNSEVDPTRCEEFYDIDVKKYVTPE